MRVSVDDSNRRRILGVDVESAAVIRHPQIASVVAPGALHRFPFESPCLPVLIMGERIVTRRLCPQHSVAGGECVLDYMFFLQGAGIVGHGLASFQRIDIEQCPVGRE